ncbi:MAG TPA: DUF1064 domain-containing protein [Paludibacter sp.]|nr:DUF1064 domain-containing protein [Paludibacter sp.]
MTIDEFRKLKKSKPSKYHNTRVGEFDSKKEHTRATTLRLMEKAGIISDLQFHVPFELIETQYEFYQVQGKRGMLNRKRCVERSCVYEADAVYVRDGNTVVEDTKPERKKGMPDLRTAEYVIKRKLMLKIWGITILET